MPFTQDTLKFLAALERNNTREWFQPRKEEYILTVRDPMFALVEELNRRFEQFAPDYVTQPERAVFRVYRDTRFSSDKRPYKTNIGALFWHKRVGKNEGPGFYVSISPKETMVAGGLYMPPSAQTLLLRQHIADQHKRLRKILLVHRLQTRFGDLQGESLVRAPKGFAPDHPAIDLLKRKDWVLWRTEGGDVCLDRRFTASVEDGFRLLAPFVAFLNEPMMQRAARPKDPLAAG